MKNLIVIDLGSNSLRMAINRRQPDGTYQEVKHLRNPTRLSHEMGPKKILQPRVVKQAIQALKGFKAIYSKLPDVKVVGIATAAVRMASNQKSFLKRVWDAIGVHVKVLTGVQEATYDYLGVKDHVRASRYVIMDVGGGSIEIIYADHQRYHVISLPIGAVSLSEKYRLNDVVSGTDLFAAQEAFRKRLSQISWLQNVSHVPLILLGGAHRALARISLHQDQLPVNRLSGYTLTRSRIFDEYRQLLAANLKQREKIPGLEVNRAPVIVGGLLPLTLMMNYLRVNQVHFSNCGVRQGLIRDTVK